MIKNCIVCGAVFTTSRDYQRFCSPRCRERNRWKRTQQDIKDKTAARNAEIVRQYREGVTPEQIADRNGISAARVHQVIKAAGLKTPARQKREARNAAICAYVASGHTRREAAEHFGVSLSCASSAAAGLPANNNPPQADVETLIKWIPAGFEYAGGYTSSEGTVELRCRKCGGTFDRSCITLRHGKNITCPRCAERERAEREQARKEQAAERIRARASAKRRAFWKQNFSQISAKQCTQCGGLFIGKGATCSEECRRAKTNHAHDRRLKRANVIDGSITLRKLYRRDGGRCWLCGGKCDYNDHTRTPDGFFIAGANYPSIDHVQPLAKDGNHTWGNVRLAHCYCNTLKRDKVITA